MSGNRLASFVCLWPSIALAMTLIGACGGGGGGGGGGGSSVPIPPPVTIAIAPASIDVSANVNSMDAPSARIDLAASDLPSTANYLIVQYTNRGIATLDVVATSPRIAVVTMTFKEARSMRPGDYDDSIQVQFCEEISCVHVVPGTQRTVPVKYRVGAATGAMAVGVSFSPQRVSAKAFLYDQDVPLISVDVGLSNFYVTPHVELSFTRNVITDAGYGIRNSAHYVLNVRLPRPAQTGIGEFHDTMTLKMCLDLQCVNPVEGSPFTVPVDYVVSDTAAASNGESFRMQVIESEAVELAWDLRRSTFYVSLQNDPTVSYNDFVATLDPNTGAMGPKVSWEAAIGNMTLSDDGEYLYAGVADMPAVLRMKVPDLVVDLNIPLPRMSDGQIVYPGDVEVAPGSSHTIAVALARAPGGGAPGGVAVFDDSTVRPWVAEVDTRTGTGPLVDYLQWGADATVLYGTGETPSSDLFTFSVGAMGIASFSVLPAVGPGRMHYAGGRLYGDQGGTVVDPATLSILGRVSGFLYVYSVLPDLQGGHLFAYGAGVNGAQQIKRYDLVSLSEQSTLTLPLYLAPSSPMHRWGTNGLAYVSWGKIVLITGTFVGP